MRAGTRSSAELRAYLQARHIPSEEIRRTLEACVQRGWLDDRACAKLWATYLADRGYACAAVRERLAAKGLAAGVIERAVRPLETERPDATRAREALMARRSHLAQQDARSRARLMRWLARRGYDADVIETVLGDVANAE